ncbi:MAG: FecCD family ABC transporter permease [Methanobacteriaceae archaeon]
MKIVGGIGSKVDNTLMWGLLILLPVTLFFASFLIGRFPISPYEVILTIFSYFDPSLEVSKTVSSVVFDIRLPRIISAMVIGASLSIAGASFQGIFKNPLVSPDILGVSSGAGFGAAIAIFISLGSWLIQLLSFIFGLFSVSITYLISRKYKYEGILILVLSGMAISAFFNALISSAKFVADPYDKLPKITFWLMGSLASITMEKLLIILIPITIGIIILLVLRWRLNILAMGDEEAQSLGIDVKKIRLIIIMACTLITAASVSVSGIIGWVGLVVPHITRMIVGPDHKILLPATISIGASFLLLIDNISRTIISIEVPIGILTAIIGAPLFLYLLMKGYSTWSK